VKSISNLRFKAKPKTVLLAVRTDGEIPDLGLLVIEVFAHLQETNFESPEYYIGLIWVFWFANFTTNIADQLTSLDFLF
jgi:hypothetical protein